MVEIQYLNVYTITAARRTRAKETKPGNQTIMFFIVLVSHNLSVGFES